MVCIASFLLLAASLAQARPVPPASGRDDTRFAKRDNAPGFATTYHTEYFYATVLGGVDSTTLTAFGASATPPSAGATSTAIHQPAIAPSAISSSAHASSTALTPGQVAKEALIGGFTGLIAAGSLGGLAIKFGSTANALLDAIPISENFAEAVAVANTPASVEFFSELSTQLANQGLQLSTETLRNMITNFGAEAVTSAAEAQPLNAASGSAPASGAAAQIQPDVEFLNSLCRGLGRTLYDPRFNNAADILPIADAAIQAAATAAGGVGTAAGTAAGIAKFAQLAGIDATAATEAIMGQVIAETVGGIAHMPFAPFSFLAHAFQHLMTPATIAATYNLPQWPRPASESFHTAPDSGNPSSSTESFNTTPESVNPSSSTESFRTAPESESFHTAPEGSSEAPSEGGSAETEIHHEIPGAKYRTHDTSSYGSEDTVGSESTASSTETVIHHEIPGAEVLSHDASSSGPEGTVGSESTSGSESTASTSETVIHRKVPDAASPDSSGSSESQYYDAPSSPSAAPASAQLAQPTSAANPHPQPAPPVKGQSSPAAKPAAPAPAPAVIPPATQNTAGKPLTPEEATALTAEQDFQAEYARTHPNNGGKPVCKNASGFCQYGDHR
ncbi:hypothetical protein H2201_006218 [Coniosporium apollinis]|uniref:C3H1-type domain-containing protein n=1 Tax=Coniosporium apollinis TaxID=61459 RepID=A0ABQ9NQZ8_9PEZI|nr:hypothetical protein H2201_006218 [Coniosporium apollinis]